MQYAEEQARVEKERSELDVMKLERELEKLQYQKKAAVIARMKKSDKWRDRIWLALHYPSSSRKAKALKWFFCCIILLSVVLFACESVNTFKASGEDSIVCEVAVEAYCADKDSRLLDPGCFVADSPEDERLEFQCSESTCFGQGTNFGGGDDSALTCEGFEAGNEVSSTSTSSGEPLSESLLLPSDARIDPIDTSYIGLVAAPLDHHTHQRDENHQSSVENKNKRRNGKDPREAASSVDVVFGEHRRGASGGSVLWMPPERASTLYEMFDDDSCHSGVVGEGGGEKAEAGSGQSGGRQGRGSHAREGLRALVSSFCRYR